jgi:DNA-binding transcriptional regulator GbsR (MarR family)
LSASEIAKKTKLPQSRVASAVRELKAAKRIFQGGDRRFARYAGDPKTALRASTNARKNAAGPRKK